MNGLKVLYVTFFQNKVTDMKIVVLPIPTGAVSIWRTSCGEAPGTGPPPGRPLPGHREEIQRRFPQQTIRTYAATVQALPRHRIPAHFTRSRETDPHDARAIATMSAKLTYASAAYAAGEAGADILPLQAHAYPLL